MTKLTQRDKHTHAEAMSIICATSYVTGLSYEEAIAVYLRARHILRDEYSVLASPMPTNWEPTAAPAVETKPTLTPSLTGDNVA